MTPLVLMLLGGWALVTVFLLGGVLSEPHSDLYEFCGRLLLILVWPVVLLAALVQAAWWLLPPWIADPLAALGEALVELVENDREARR